MESNLLSKRYILYFTTFILVCISSSCKDKNVVLVSKSMERSIRCWDPNISSVYFSQFAEGITNYQKKDGGISEKYHLEFKGQESMKKYFTADIMYSYTLHTFEDQSSGKARSFTLPKSYKLKYEVDSSVSLSMRQVDCRTVLIRQDSSGFVEPLSSHQITFSFEEKLNNNKSVKGAYSQQPIAFDFENKASEFRMIHVEDLYNLNDPVIQDFLAKNIFKIDEALEIEFS
ncbi:MAG: hypothetical protein MRY83_07740, partial [Flavobacteriales bacterium]|nr:hypothetical protein [Flavobacteriales bacterium]